MTTDIFDFEIFFVRREFVSHTYTPSTLYLGLRLGITYSHNQSSRYVPTYCKMIRYDHCKLDRREAGSVSDIILAKLGT